MAETPEPTCASCGDPYTAHCWLSWDKRSASLGVSVGECRVCAECEDWCEHDSGEGNSG